MSTEIVSNANAAAISKAKAKVEKLEIDGMIYYIIPNGNCNIKSGFIYCNYLMNNNETNETINSIKTKLTQVYSTTGQELNLMIGKCADTQTVYGTFLSKTCIPFDEPLKEGDTMTDEEGNEIVMKISYHDNIFKAKQTELKEALVEAASVCGISIRFVNYADLFSVGKTDQIKKRNPVKKQPKKDKPEGTKNVKLNKKDDDKKSDEKDDKKSDDKKVEDKKADDKKPEAKKSAVPRKPGKINKKNTGDDEVLVGDEENKPKKPSLKKPIPKKIETEDEDFDAPETSAPEN